MHSLGIWFLFLYLGVKRSLKYFLSIAYNWLILIFKYLATTFIEKKGFELMAGHSVP